MPILTLTFIPFPFYRHPYPYHILNSYNHHYSYSTPCSWDPVQDLDLEKTTRYLDLEYINHRMDQAPHRVRAAKVAFERAN